jgi:hypothetical protein
MGRKQDKVTRNINVMLNRAWPAIREIMHKNQSKAKPAGSLDEKEQRRKKMLRNNTPLPGQLSLFDTDDQ